MAELALTRRPVLSLGAGVQSSAMALMAAEGRWGVVPELAIFADTHPQASRSTAVSRDASLEALGDASRAPGAAQRDASRSAAAARDACR